MTAAELSEAKAELARLKAVRLARFEKGVLKGASNGNERVEREFAPFEALDARIREIDREIRFAEGRWGALHTR